MVKITQTIHTGSWYVHKILSLDSCVHKTSIGFQLFLRVGRLNIPRDKRERVDLHFKPEFYYNIYHAILNPFAIRTSFFQLCLIPPDSEKWKRIFLCSTFCKRANVTFATWKLATFFYIRRTIFFIYIIKNMPALGENVLIARRLKKNHNKIVL